MNLPIAYGIALALAAVAVGAFIYGETVGGVIFLVAAAALVVWARRGAEKR